MKRYRMEKTFIDDMGSIDSLIVHDTVMESKEEHALWFINSMRRHDGLEPLTLDELPYDLTFTFLGE